MYDRKRIKKIMSSNCESILVLRTGKQELMTPPLPDTCMITINLCFNVMLDVVFGGEGWG